MNSNDDESKRLQLQVEARRKTVRVGRQFAGSIATRLDAHPRTADASRIADERTIIEMVHDVLRHPHPDVLSVNALTQFIETHTKMYGFSRTIYEEVRKAQQSRIQHGRGSVEDMPMPSRRGADEGLATRFFARPADTPVSPSGQRQGRVAPSRNINALGRGPLKA